MHIRTLKIGDTARITAVKSGEKSSGKAYRQRLIAMGLIPGAAFTVTRIAPLGDPVEILVRGVAVSLRKEEAGILQIEICK
jgi:ferrous iron transport protein A